MSDRLLYKPAPDHNPLRAPGACMCVECSKIILALRCKAVDGSGHQCGDYAHHRGEHKLLVATCFDIAAQRAAERPPVPGEGKQ